MIARAVRKLAKLVRGDRPAPVVPGFLRPIDTDALARELNLLAMAADRGASDLPRTDESALDGVEQKIIQRVESVWAWQGDELIKQLRAYASRLTGYSVQAELTQLRLIAENARARLFNVSHQADAELGPLKEEYLAARNELREFRARHRLERPARTPAGRWTTFGFLFVLIAAESVLNGFFFAKGSEFGLIGGIGTAIGISGVNVAVAFLLGIGPARLIHHRKIALRMAALLATLCGAALIVLLHVFAAHYRDAVALVGENDALKTAIDKLLHTPWALNDPSSAYLSGLGLLFGIGSFWKGYTFDDPYPGYGAVFRRAEKIREAYSDEHKLLFDDLEDLKEEAVQRLDRGIASIPIYPQQAAQIRTQRTALVGRFRAYETQVQTATNQLLHLYRDENRRRRNTSPPSHFNERWKLPHSFVESSEVLLLTTDEPDTTSDKMPAIRNELLELSQSLLSDYRALLTRYPHPTDME